MRLGEHTAMLQYACEKVVPEDAKRARLGVCIKFAPNGSASGRKS